MTDQLTQETTQRAALQPMVQALVEARGTLLRVIAEDGTQASVNAYLDELRQAAAEAQTQAAQAQAKAEQAQAQYALIVTLLDLIRDTPEEES
jgi:ferric iron reductase protein FhuF